MSAFFADRERRKLGWSLGANLLTRISSLAMVFLILPLLIAGLGPERYAALFAALAVGVLASIPMGGTGILGVRLIGDAASRGDRAGEAAAFLGLAIVNFSLAFGLIILTVIFMIGRGNSPALVCVALLPIVQAACNGTFDNARLAYNEHYWTAGLGLGLQLFWYALLLLAPPFRHHVLLAATVFHAPTTVASIANGALLLRARPYLLRGRAVDPRKMLRTGASFGAAEGLLMGALSVVVIYLQATSTASVTAWFATQNRLFQMCLTPLMMVLMPLGGFVRLKWADAGDRRQRDAIKAAYAAGAVALIGIAGGLSVIGPFYAQHWLHLAPPAGGWLLMPLFALFGAITFYRCFAAIAYLVLDGAWLAHRVIAAVLVAGFGWLVATRFLPPVQSFGVFAAVTTILIVAALSRSARHTLAGRPA
ncbi:MAG: hypothetical protein WC729_01855 [Sphingomonas sp.]|jgi:hypothetical protein|uniref:hypothetical protein n=1 Tax=Sphingomonas sp. TaxID=28214 RepID=UPI0035626DC8